MNEYILSYKKLIKKIDSQIIDILIKDYEDGSMNNDVINIDDIEEKLKLRKYICNEISNCGTIFTWEGTELKIGTVLDVVFKKTTFGNIRYVGKLSEIDINGKFITLENIMIDDNNDKEIGIKTFRIETDKIVQITLI